ncbi:ferrous iron transport protein B [Cryomorphaceae bacterium 1068]|nr:ferrous iron transport protein B [Cryomorphaceae bacterium 1068]
MAKSKSSPLIALTGVPNVGKTTIFNKLTGLNQKVGNYPGVTVDKVIGRMKTSTGTVDILDLPGTYNLYPRSEDERVVFRVLSGLEPDIEVAAVITIADMSNPERSLFLVTQLVDMGYPTALVLNMEDQAKKEGLEINKILLQRLLGIPVFTASADKGIGIDQIKKAIEENGFSEGRKVVDPAEFCDESLLLKVSGITKQSNPYQALQVLKFKDEEKQIPKEIRERLSELVEEYSFNPAQVQREETKIRYDHVREILSKCLKSPQKKRAGLTRKLDSIFLHPVFGFGIFLAILFMVFQAIFSWAEGPMDFIDTSFAFIAQWVSEALPSGALTDLLTEGIIPGLGGIVIFVPQIALLFAFLSLLEGSGYMARAVFITDRVMRPFGLNGRSVVPLISGFACAIPGIMAARTISNRRDRLITIFVTPFMSCSARLPVYIVLVGLLFPDGESTFFNSKGTAFFGLYLLGILAALVSAAGMKAIMKTERSGTLVLELPRYRVPQLQTVVTTMYEKSKTFVLEAGKIILAISIVLWVLASYGPGDSMEQAASSVALPKVETAEAMHEYHTEVSSKKIQASYAGIVGKWVEPVIRPLGYDWKIGIALICSFAAREVFVSTMATIYSIGADSEDIQTLQQLLSTEKRDDTGEPTFTSATVWSLLVFYAFAMQCMSTIAIVKRETNGWKWPIIQTVYMTALAYVSALFVYQLLS